VLYRRYCSLADNDLINGKGKRDSLIDEAVKQFVLIMND